MIYKVYIVKCSSGLHDEYYWWIGGIFSTAKDAEDYCQKLNDKMKCNAEAPEPFTEGYAYLTEEERKIQDDWEDKKNAAQEWHEAKVEEHVLT